MLHIKISSFSNNYKIFTHVQGRRYRGQGGAPPPPISRNTLSYHLVSRTRTTLGYTATSSVCGSSTTAYSSLAQTSRDKAYSLVSCGLIMHNLGPYPFTRVALIRVSFTVFQLGPGPNLHSQKTSDFALCVDDKQSEPLHFFVAVSASDVSRYLLPTMNIKLLVHQSFYI